MLLHMLHMSSLVSTIWEGVLYIDDYNIDTNNNDDNAA